MPAASQRAAASMPSLAPDPLPLTTARSKKRTARLIASVALVFIVVLGGSAALVLTLSGKTRPSLPPGYQVFTSPDHSFSIAYPPGWERSHPNSGTGGAFNGPDSRVFIVSHLGRTDLTPGHFDQDFCSGSQGFGGAPSTPQMVQIGSREWTREECDNADGTLHAATEAILYQGELYYMIAVAQRATFAQSTATYFSVMERSFAFLT